MTAELQGGLAAWSADILTTPAELETWMTAPADDAMKLQRPLADGALKIVGRGKKKDEATSP